MNHDHNHNDDLFDSLLDVEEGLYEEGYDLGVADGVEAGYVEGSVFAVEKGFENFLEIGRLYGKALVWAQRMPGPNNHPDPIQQRSSGIHEHQHQHHNNDNDHSENLINQKDEISLGPSACNDMSHLPRSSRLAKNLSSLLELVDPASLVMQNTEDALTDAEERRRGALVKAKLIQRVLGEREGISDIHPDMRETPVVGDGSGSIEDISSLSIRH